MRKEPGLPDSNIAACMEEAIEAWLKARDSCNDGGGWS
jgi:hypothetical protein